MDGRTEDAIEAFEGNLYSCVNGKVFKYDAAEEEWKSLEHRQQV